MITNEHGGSATRSLPPTGGDYGIPDTVYDKSLTRGQIFDILLASYLSDANKQWLKVGDDPLEQVKFEVGMCVTADVDAGTIYWHNQLDGREKTKA